MKYLRDAVGAVKTAVIARTLPFARAIESPELVQQILREFPGVPFRRAAREAWAELVAEGELEIRRPSETGGRFSIWFLSGQYAECMWEGDGHRQATLRAIVIERQQYAGAGVVDRVELPARVLVPRRLNLTTFARGGRRIRGKA